MADIFSEMAQIPDLEEFFEAHPIALYRSSSDGRLLAGNAALAAILGFDDTSDFYGGEIDVSDFYVRPGDRDKWLAAIKEKGVVHDLDVELRRVDGATIWVRDSARMVSDSSGNTLHFEGSLIDVTDRVRLQRVRDEFVATVSHELRNPITVILGLSRELSDDFGGFSAEEQERIIKLVADEAEEAAWLIEDLLVAHHDDPDKIKIAPISFDVVEEAKRVVEFAGQPIEVSGAAQAVVFADPGRTRQILRNLISNAERYGGPTIWAEIEVNRNAVIVSICDSGKAIDTDSLERIFQPFGVGSGNNHPGSVGLGLSVSRKLAALMGGSLTYGHDGHRSSFRLVLPNH